MVLNQSLIKDLIIGSIAEAKTRSSFGKVCFIQEKNAFYVGRLEPSATADDDMVIESSLFGYYWFKSSSSSAMATLDDSGVPQESELSAVGNPIPFSTVAGREVADVLLDLLYPPTIPNTTPPSLTVTYPTTGVYKVGTKIEAEPIAYTFNQGDAGELSIPASGTWKSATVEPEVTQPVTDSGSTFPLTSGIRKGINQFELRYGTQPGPIPTDSRGVERPEYRVGGVYNEVSIITGSYFTHYGLVPKGQDIAPADSAEARVLLDGLSDEQAGTLSTLTSFNLPNVNDLIIAVPGAWTSIKVIRAGFETDIAEVVSPALVVDDYGTGDDNEPYTVFRVNGQADDSVLDTIIIS